MGAKETVIEVADHDNESDTYYVVAAWDTKSDWLQNIRREPDAKIKAGRRKIHARVEVLD
ncbi:MAG TPA: hypothetical protein VLE49_13910 [Anaerolineales bacterium]|nr:hypothetical protein [Anaerolineales bacterium]